MCADDSKERVLCGKSSILPQVISPPQAPTGSRLKCRWLRKSQAFEFITDPPGKAWLGVSNIHHKGQQDEAEEVSIKRHLRHLKTYRCRHLL